MAPPSKGGVSDGYCKAVRQGQCCIFLRSPLGDFIAGTTPRAMWSKTATMARGVCRGGLGKPNQLLGQLAKCAVNCAGRRREPSNIANVWNAPSERAPCPHRAINERDSTHHHAPKRPQRLRRRGRRDNDERRRAPGLCWCMDASGAPTAARTQRGADQAPLARRVATLRRLRSPLWWAGRCVVRMAGLTKRTQLWHRTRWPGARGHTQ